MRRKFLATWVAILGLAWMPAVAAAQTAASGIAGVVRDTSGAVMPGVTVEAASPALIEKVRTVVTDEQGQYKIVDLRPGIYTVTFTLTGFSTVKREGIELPAGFTATVNAEMRVGALEETITVSGQSPTVDVQNVKEQKVLSQEVLNALPTARAPRRATCRTFRACRAASARSAATQRRWPSTAAARANPTWRSTGSKTTARRPGGGSFIYYINRQRPGSSVEVVGPVGRAADGRHPDQPHPEGRQQPVLGLPVSRATATTDAGGQPDRRTARQGLTAVNSLKKIWDVNPAWAARS